MDPGSALYGPRMTTEISEPDTAGSGCTCRRAPALEQVGSRKAISIACSALSRGSQTVGSGR